jgi:hypothetical protein
MSSQKSHRFVLDLGIAAYLLMHGYKVVGKKAKAIYFECNNEQEALEFNKYILEYQPPNEFYLFDSCLMYLKKIGENLLEDIQDSNYRTVSDLGTAAYLMLHECSPNKMGIKFLGRRDRLVYFKVPVNKTKEFEELSFEYLPSPFHYLHILQKKKKEEKN